MQTETTQSLASSAAVAPVPATGAPAHPHPAPVHETQQQQITPAPQPQKTQDQPSGTARWLGRNRWFTKEPLTYWGYQAFRATMATIPYGFGMATVHHLFGLISVAGQRMGLTEKGIEAFNKGGIAAKVGELELNSVKFIPELHQPGLKGEIGRNIMRLGNSPLNQALQIGVSFTMFRFVGGLIKTVRDKVMDEKNTPEDTHREVKNAAKTIRDTAKVNWKPEYTGTLWAGLTLGFINALFKQSEPYQRKMLEGGQVEKTFDAFKRVWGKSSKLLQNCAIWTISYSAFFEISERINKDTKVREGTWKGNANSLLPKKDDTVGTPPQKDEKGEVKPEAEQAPKPKYAAFTADPSMGRVIFRRVLPVAVGISAYAVLKRAGYVLVGGQMKPVTDEVVRKGVAENIKHWGTNVWREGGATSMFFALWMATDTWGMLYDKFFDHLQNKDNAKPLTDHQHQKYDELLTRVNAKEQQNARTA